MKDEMEKTALMRSSFLDRELRIKVHQSLEQMEHMKSRQYTPRKLAGLFNEQIQRRKIHVNILSQSRKNL
jgi:hypothetical protein